MKKILLFLFLSSSFFSEAQTSVYHPFPDSSAMWCNSWVSFQGCGSPTTEVHDTYKMDGEVSINGFAYYKLLHYGTYDYNCVPWDFHTIDTISYYIRQDASLKKVWLYNTTYNTDEILYDFNLNIGDTLDTTRAYWIRFVPVTDHWIVTSIDSILINGNYRRQFNYSAGFLPGSSVEGIGALHGFMYRPNDFELGSTLHLFMQDNRTIYPTSGDTAHAYAFFCHHFSTDVFEINSSNLISVSPNPFEDKISITIQKENFRRVTFAIKNVLGETLLNYELRTANYELNLSHLAQGIYFLEVMVDGEKVVKKIVKE